MHAFRQCLRRWLFRGLANAALLLLFLYLLTHQSDSPAVFNRYSVDYTIALLLCALNLGFFWWNSDLRAAYRRLRGRFPLRRFWSLLLAFIAVAFLIDFVGIDPPQSSVDWVILMLFGILVLQVEAAFRLPVFMSGNAALLAWSLALTLIVLELFFAFVLLEPRNPKTEKEFLRLMTSLWPRPISVQKPPGTIRILGLSDSFGVWLGTANYHHLLEEILRRDHSPNTQMVNVSVPAYQPLHQLAILRFAMPYSPDLVLHGFFVGNDFETYGEDMYTFQNIPTRRETNRSPYRPRNFLTIQWIYNALARFQNHREIRFEATAAAVGEIGTYSEERFGAMQFYRLNEWGKRGETNVNRMKEIYPVIDAIRSTVEQSGARYVMVIHPDQTQIDNALRQELMTRFNVNEDDYDFDLPQELLRSYCADRQIPCLDLLPILRAKAKDGDLYLPRDTHYNRAGNELVAASIAQFLLDRLVLPDTGRKALGSPKAK